MFSSEGGTWLGGRRMSDLGKGNGICYGSATGESMQRIIGKFYLKEIVNSPFIIWCLMNSLTQAII